MAGRLTAHLGASLLHARPSLFLLLAHLDGLRPAMVPARLLNVFLLLLVVILQLKLLECLLLGDRRIMILADLGARLALSIIVVDNGAVLVNGDWHRVLLLTMMLLRLSSLLWLMLHHLR